jgi:hypothetical protein
VRPLNRELANPSESERDLNNEVFSTKLADEPREAVKPIVRALNKELARFNEPEKDLKNELFSARPDEEPKEPLGFLARPLV